MSRNLLMSLPARGGSWPAGSKCSWTRRVQRERLLELWWIWCRKNPKKTLRKKMAATRQSKKPPSCPLKRTTTRNSLPWCLPILPGKKSNANFIPSATERTASTFTPLRSAPFSPDASMEPTASTCIPIANSENTAPVETATTATPRRSSSRNQRPQPFPLPFPV